MGEWTDPLLEVLRKKYSNCSVNSPTGTTDRELERIEKQGESQGESGHGGDEVED